MIWFLIKYSICLIILNEVVIMFWRNEMNEGYPIADTKDVRRSYYIDHHGWCGFLVGVAAAFIKFI